MKYLFVSAFACLLSISIQAQTLERSVVASGGGSTPRASYTIGETVIQGTINSTISVTAGFQQPVTFIVETTGLEDITATLNVFPNPSSRFVNIAGNGQDLSAHAVRIYNAEGREITVPMTQTSDIRLDFIDQTGGVYFIILENASDGTVAKFQLLHKIN